MPQMDELFVELQREYLTEAPARIGELRKDLAALLAGEADAVASLRTRFHRLAGSGGSYGFPVISAISRKIEQWLIANPGCGPAGADRIERAIVEVTNAFDGLGASIGTSSSTVPEFAWRALVVGPEGELQHQATALLHASGFLVETARTPADTPLQLASNRPDIVLLLAAACAESPETLLAIWQAHCPEPSPALVVVEEPGRLGPLAAARAGVDRLLAPADLDRTLPAWTRTVTRIRAAPFRATLLAPSPERVQPIMSAMEKAGLHVTAFETILDLLRAIELELPDLVLGDWGAKGEFGEDLATLVRVIRASDRFSLLPVMVVEFAGTESGRVSLLSAGMDSVLPPTNRIDLARIARSRAERGRSVRVMAHRDDLTGTLTRGALMGELDVAVAHAKRHGEGLGVCVIDIDHFRRLNERFGPVVGDAALSHIAEVVGGGIRSSDTLGRLGGEEFGVILHQNTAAGAEQAAEKLRAMIAASPLQGPGDVPIPLQVTIGLACYPEDGDTAPAVANAAEQALREGKLGGRDRVSRFRPSDETQQ